MSTMQKSAVCAAQAGKVAASTFGQCRLAQSGSRPSSAQNWPKGVATVALAVAAALTMPASVSAQQLTPGYNYQRNNAIYLAYDHLCRTGEFERRYEGDGEYETRTYQQLMIAGATRRRTSDNCMAFSFLHLPAAHANRLVHDAYPGWPNTRPTLDGATAAMMGGYLWYKWASDEGLCQAGSQRDRKIASLLETYVYEPFGDQLVAHDYQTVGDLFALLVYGRNLDHTTITADHPQIAEYCSGGFGTIQMVMEGQMNASAFVDRAAIIDGLTELAEARVSPLSILETPSYPTEPSSSNSHRNIEGSSVQPIESLPRSDDPAASNLFRALEGWWWYDSLGPQGCHDEDGQYRFWIGRSYYDDTGIHFGVGERKILNYDGGCTVETITGNDNEIVLSSQCGFEDDEFSGDVRINVVNPDRLTMQIPGGQPFPLNRCEAEQTIQSSLLDTITDIPEPLSETGANSSPIELGTVATDNPQIIICSAPDHADITLGINSREGFGETLSCIDSDFIIDMTPCAPDGGYGMSIPMGTAALGGLSYRWQDTFEHNGGIMGYSSSDTAMQFTGWFSYDGDARDGWRFEVNRLDGTGVLERNERNGEAVARAYACRAVERMF